MQNQFQTEETNEHAYTRLTPPQEELTNEITQTVEQTQAVHLWLAKIQQKARRDKTWFWGFYIFLQLFVFVPILLSQSFPIMRNSHINPVAMALLMMPAAGMALMAIKLFLTKPKWNADELMRIGGVEAVGTLLDLLAVPKAPRQLPPLYAALTELLPQMKASDATMLTAEQRKMLYWTLKNGYGGTRSPAVQQNYRLAVLKAMEQIGDAAAIPIVEQLANGRARTAAQTALQAAAIECLPLLRVNFGGAEATKTLLRASSAEQSAPEMLVRPVEFIPEASPKQLLRAAKTPVPPPPSV